MVITCKRWFIYILDQFQLLFTSASLFILVLFAENFSGSLIGLVISYLLVFGVEFQWFVISWSNLETYLCSVDRIERMGMNIDSKYETFLTFFVELTNI